MPYCEKDKEGAREAVKIAASFIREGELVAFPTETVYGLGADALNNQALKKIYAVKGRPADNPLIVHVASLSQLELLVADFPPRAQLLAEKFWPGPLTMVLCRNEKVSPFLTAGLPTIAVRMPAHPAALALITESETPIAAPSANISGTVSPTESSHVMDDLRGEIAAVLDGGRCNIGLESTVLDLSGEESVILRPGSVTAEMLAAVLPEPVISVNEKKGILSRPSSPGMKYRHYATRAPLFLFRGDSSAVREAILRECSRQQEKGNKVGILCRGGHKDFPHNLLFESMGEKGTPEEAAFTLYNSLRNLDRLGADIILVEGIEEAGVGAAVMNRLRKSAAKSLEFKGGGVKD